MNTYFLGIIEPERKKKIRKVEIKDNNFHLSYSKRIKLNLSFRYLSFELGCNFMVKCDTLNESFLWVYTPDITNWSVNFPGRNWYFRLNDKVVTNMMYPKYWL